MPFSVDENQKKVYPLNPGYGSIVLKCAIHFSRFLRQAIWNGILCIFLLVFYKALK